MEKEIEFLSGPDATFRFECEACGRCCGEYRIVLSPYDIVQLRKATGRSTTELIRRGTIRVERLSFKKIFGFGPIADMLDMFGLTKPDTVPVAFLGFQMGHSGKETCEFLSPASDRKRLCTIYKNRPGMCRLHPLGCTTIEGRLQWFYRRPLCYPHEGHEQTVSDWLRTSDMDSFIRANARFLDWMRMLLEEGENLSAIAEPDWRELEQVLYDFDYIGGNAGDIDMDIIDTMFKKWLSRIRSGYGQGG